MSTQRVQLDRGSVWGDRLPKGPNGRNLCRRCSTEVPRGRVTFCSDACVHEWRLRTDPAYLRVKVFERDRGVCGSCGLDTNAQRPASVRHRARGSGHLWQADHVVPVVEGGGECGLDNLRTLCTACHRRATAELAARMAMRRRDAAGVQTLDFTGERP